MSNTAGTPNNARSTLPSADATCNAGDRGASVVFIGALPPPVTGMTAMTAVIVDALQRQGPVTCFNWSRGKPMKGWRWKAARTWGAFKSLIGLAWRGPARGAVIYYPVSSGAGLYNDLAIAAVGRLLGYRLVLHHHSYVYINRRDWRVASLDRLVGVKGAHAVHCELMQQHFLAQYESKASFLFVPPTIVSQQLETAGPRSSSSADFVLGFMSNLTITKGIDDAIATFEQLARSGRRVRLILAGPCMAATDRELVDQALARWPEQIEYRGPVYGREKAQFFADVDVFLFPTRYVHESWGIVLTEAMSVGCPVITRSRGCVPWIVRNGCGYVIEDGVDFPAAAAEHVIRWMEEPAGFAAARAAAAQRSVELEQDATTQLPAFVEGLRARRQA
jgi:glycosyltransferase involved in cell wall biosynthesis